MRARLAPLRVPCEGDEPSVAEAVPLFVEAAAAPAAATDGALEAQMSEADTLE